MKVLILTFGTQGDVQPFVALARRLVARGHEAVVAAPRRFRPLVEAQGLLFGELDDGPLQQMDVGAAVGDVAAKGLGATIALARRLPPMFGQVLADAWAVASEGVGADADVIVHNGQVLAGHHIAEKLDVPAVLGLPLPMYVPTRAFPWPAMELPALPTALHRASYVGMRAPTLTFGRTIDRWRAESLGLPRRRRRHDPLVDHHGRPTLVLHAISPRVIPRPTDWPATSVMTGYWQLPTQPDAVLPDRLEAFLAAGEPPVYIGFGSMSGADPASTTRDVLDAVQRRGVRAVLARGWGGMQVDAEDDDRVLAVDTVPHDLLFGRVSAVVHHGGAGTTAAAVAAGRPQVVCPFVADQPFWAARMHTLGVAAEPLPQKQLTGRRLAERLAALLDDEATARRARALAAAVRREDGAVEAVSHLERVGGVPGSGSVP